MPSEMMSERVRTWIYWIAVLLIPTVPLIFTQHFHRCFTLPKFAALISGAVVLFFLLGDYLLFDRGERDLRHWFFLVIGAELLVMIVSVTLSIDRMVSFMGSFERQMGFITHVSFMTCCLAVIIGIGRDKERFVRAARIIAAMAAAAAFYGIYEHFVLKHALYGTVGNPNYYANFLLFSAFVYLGLIFYERSPLVKVLWAVCLAGLLVSLYYSNTRGSWMGFVFGCGFFVVLSGVLQRIRKIPKSILLPAAAVALIVFAFFGAVLVGRIRKEPTGSGRTIIWRDVRPFLRDHVLVGCGIECFRVAFMPLKSIDLAKYLPNANWRNPHNTPMDMLATKGIWGLMTYLALVGSGAYFFYKSTRNAGESRERWMLTGVGSSFGAYLVHNFFNCDVVPTGLYLWTFLGLSYSAFRIYGQNKRDSEGDGTGEGASQESSAPGAPGGAGGSAGNSSAITSPAAPSHAAPSRFSLGRFAYWPLALVAVLYVWDFAYTQLLADRNILLAMAFSSQKNLRKVLQHGHRAVELSPYQGSYHYLFSKQLEPFTLKNPLDRQAKEILDLAIKEAQKSVSFTTNPEGFYGHLSALYARAGKKKESKEALMTSISNDRFFWATRRLLAIHNLSEGKIEEAKKNIEIARTILPKEPTVQQTYNQILMVERSRGSANFFRQAQVLAKLRQHKKAIEAYKKAIEARKGHYPEAYNNMGVSLLLTGQIQKAMAAYRTAIAQRRGLFPQAHNGLAACLYRLGKIDEAAKEYQAALVQTRGNFPEASNGLGLCFFQKGKIDAAIIQFRFAVKGRHRFPEAHRNLAMALEKKGQYAEAAGHLKIYLQQVPRAADATAVKAKIDQLESKGKKK
jgi:tetratricopeptide (TPR) repeat protein